MKGSPYRDYDYTFGKTMLTLRTKIGLTQTALALTLGVSRRAISDWEAGKSYPKTGHLRDLIALAVRQHAFHVERAAEDIRELWRASHQKVLLDESWLNELLTQSSGVEEQASLPGDGIVTQFPSPNKTFESTMNLDWGGVLTVPVFYGRERELGMLMGWIIKDRCRVVNVIGFGGIGKSALAVNLMHRSSEHFDSIIWRSLHDRPDCSMLLNNLLQEVEPQSLAVANDDIEKHQSTLLEHMRRNRILLVLDNLESVMEEGKSSGRFIPGYEILGRFLRLSAETEHQSCILLTSREKPVDLIALEGSHSPVRTLRIARLDSTACETILKEKGIKGTIEERAHLTDMYAGNPLALKIVAQTIATLFDGELAPFFEQGEAIFGGIRELLDEQFGRLAALEQRVLFWLAILREPATLNDLLAVMVAPVPRATLLETVDALRRRSLIEPGPRQGSFVLQSVVLEYTTSRLITEAGTELQNGKLTRLIEHGLELATSKEYVRQTQRRLFIVPLLAQIRSRLPSQTDLERHLLMLLDELRTQADHAQGYGPTNLLALLREVRGQLRDLDLTGLAIRKAFLQGVEMQNTNLTGTNLQDTVFARSFDTVWAIAISHSGRYWAAGSGQGGVYVWREDGMVLELAWKAHSGTVWSLAFSPDEDRLATGSWDGSIRLWDINDGRLLWMNWHTNNDIHCLAFSPDGHILASGGDDGAIRLWDALSGERLQTLLGHNSPVHSLAWNPEGNMLASGSFDGGIRVWEKPWLESEPVAQTLAGHPHWVTGLAFSPDGSTLASSSFDGSIKLWNVESLALSETLLGHTGPLLAIDWSPDGSWIVSSSFDQTIRLWDLEKLNTRLVLHGHRAAVYAIAFMPDSHRLLSSGDDGTLRLWDIENGQCIQIMQGHAASLYDVDWNPTGTQIISASSDTSVTIWDAVSERTQPQVLSGHFWTVFGAAWSPDGRLLASAAWDNTVRIWDAITGTPLQTFQQPDHPDNGFQCVAWSPNGKFLASGSYLWGLHVWNVTTGTLHWIGREQSTRIRRVAWSPDGTQLVSCGDDGSVFVWDTRHGKPLASLQGHGGMVMSVTWSPDGTKFASGGGGKGIGEAFIWDGSSKDLIQSWSIPGSILFSLVWSANGNQVLSGGSDGLIRWWDIKSNKSIRVLKGHQGTVQSLKISPDGRTLASSGDDNSIQLWDFESGEHIRTLRHDRPYERLNISGVMGLTEAQKAALHALGAIELSS